MVDDARPVGGVWWIYSDHQESWAGLRIAHFGRATGTGGNLETFFILGDTRYRTGIRFWAEVSQREGWRKVAQINVPTHEQCERAK